MNTSRTAAAGKSGESSKSGNGTQAERPDDDLDAVQADVDRIVDAAADEARRLGEQAKAYGSAFANRQKRGVADAIADAAANLRDTGQTFDERPNVQSILLQASEALDDIADRIRTTSFSDMYESAEDYTRSRPLLVAVCAAFAGFAVARFVKSSGGAYHKPGFRSYREAGYGYGNRPM